MHFKYTLNYHFISDEKWCEKGWRFHLRKFLLRYFEFSQLEQKEIDAILGLIIQN